MVVALVVLPGAEPLVVLGWLGAVVRVVRCCHHGRARDEPARLDVSAVRLGGGSAGGCMAGSATLALLLGLVPAAFAQDVLRVTGVVGSEASNIVDGEELGLRCVFRPPLHAYCCLLFCLCFKAGWG